VSNAWRNKAYILSSIPMRKPRTFVDDASDLLVTGVSNAFSFFSGAEVSTAPKATPDEVFNGDIDLNEEEVKRLFSSTHTHTNYHCRSSSRIGEKRERWMTLRKPSGGCACLL
jgi:hypothetical protein